MKKILASLLVLALCAPAMAATVTAVTSPGQAVITVAAEGAVNIVGLGLDVDVTAGGNITACTVDTATFNIFPDAAYSIIDGGGTYGYGDGTPIANQDAAGEASLSSSFAVCAGALNGETTAGATGSASVQITVTVDAATTIQIQENALRGGIVLTDGTGEDITNGTAGVVSIDIPAPGLSECQTYNLSKVISGGTDNVLNVGDITLWVNYVNANRVAPTIFAVVPTNPNYDARYNFDSVATINVSDITQMVNYINANRVSPTIFARICAP